jgi:heme-degrading monooxygenase HmoA
MVVEYIRYHVEPGQRKTFIQAFAHVIKQMDGQPHCWGYDLLEGMHDPTLFILRVEWATLAGHHAFKPSALLPGIVREGVPFLDNVVEKHYYKQTGVSNRKQK